MVQTKRYAGLTAANTKKVAMAAPMFSIIIPTLNVAAVLPACLDSIARQTCGDFELVLVDGGSTDETLDIANIFAPNLGERLIIHRDTDQGVYDAMNRGVDLATERGCSFWARTTACTRLTPWRGWPPSLANTSPAIWYMAT